MPPARRRRHWSHPASEPLQRGLTEERKSRKLGMSTIYEYLQLVGRSNKTKTLADSLDSKHPQIYEDSDGTQVVADGRALTIDPMPALERLAVAQWRMEAAVPERDPRHRTSEDIAPLAFRRLS